MIYLDNFATTPMHPDVLKVVNEVMTNNFANPHSVSHELGWESGDLVENSRVALAKLLGANASNVIFTSGATEANNTIFKGLEYPQGKNKILISAVEHPCVIESAKYMETQGFKVEIIPVDKLGRIDIDEFSAMLDDTVALVSVMLVNNEIGTIQDIKTIADMTQTVGAILHSDCAQAVGKIEIDMKKLGIDAISLSGHKFYAPKGVGALVVNDNVKLTPLLHGGGQEKGNRSGTAPTPLICGLAKACELAGGNIKSDIKNITELRDNMESELLAQIDGAISLGDLNNRIAGSINLYIPNVYTDNFFTNLSGVAVSSGSACSSAGKKASNVLQAIGISPEKEALSIRICISNQNTADDIKIATQKIVSAVQKSK